MRDLTWIHPFFRSCDLVGSQCSRLFYRLPVGVERYTECIYVDCISSAKTLCCIPSLYIRCRSSKSTPQSVILEHIPKISSRSRSVSTFLSPLEALITYFLSSLANGSVQFLNKNFPDRLVLTKTFETRVTRVWNEFLWKKFHLDHQ